MTGDQVGVDNEFGKKPRPWELRGWFVSRLKELVYTLFSWPYLLAFTMTAAFLRDTDNVVLLQAMGGAWFLAFARREWSNWMTTKRTPGGV